MIENNVLEIEYFSSYYFCYTGNVIFYVSYDIMFKCQSVSVVRVTRIPERNVQFMERETHSLWFILV